MIVLKATQDKVLSVLQSVTDIVKRRHTLAILANTILRIQQDSDRVCPDTLVSTSAIVHVELIAKSKLLVGWLRPMTKAEEKRQRWGNRHLCRHRRVFDG